MTPKSPEALDRMRKGGKILVAVLAEVAKRVEPGFSLSELNRIADKQIKKHGAKPAFKGYKGYPYAICLSLNDEVVHGMPRQYRLQEGDILGIDIGVLFEGYYVDSALTVGVGKISPEDQSLLAVTYESLLAGIRLVKAGQKLGNIQAAIQKYVEDRGFTIVKDLCGHGIGQFLQEEPQIPNFGTPETGPTLRAGQTFALEPMVSFRSAHTATRPDGWTVVTLDGKNAAHFEHTISVTERGCEIFTARPEERFTGQKGNIRA